MATCELCSRVFRDEYNLRRHLSKVVPCDYKKKIISTRKSSELSANSAKVSAESAEESAESAKVSANSAKVSAESAEPTAKWTDGFKCEYCLKVFVKKYNLKNHQSSCKMIDDPIRLLEIKQGIDVNSLPSTECRFCFKEFKRSDYLCKHLKVCKERENYHEKLKSKSNSATNVGTQNIETQNNIHNNIQNQNNIETQNNNNGTINNNYTINVFGKESMEHIQTEKIISLLRNIRSEYDTNDVYLSAGELIISFDNYIREIPENNNINVPSSKCLYANVKTDEGWEKFPVDNMLNKGFKNSAKSLYNTKESIDEVNKKVFENNTNKIIFTEIKEFAKKGFNHAKYGDSKARKVKTSYKVNKLKNKKIVDF